MPWHFWFCLGFIIGCLINTDAAGEFGANAGKSARKWAIEHDMLPNAWKHGTNTRGSDA